MKERNKSLIGWKLVEDTAGKICNGVYVKDDYTEIRVIFAWGGAIHFKPESDIKASEVRAKLK